MMLYSHMVFRPAPLSPAPLKPDVIEFAEETLHIVPSDEFYTRTLQVRRPPVLAGDHQPSPAFIDDLRWYMPDKAIRR